MWHGVWNLRRWRMILTFVLTALNTLTGIPGPFEPPSNWILGEMIALLPVGVSILVLIALPSSSQAFRKAVPANTANKSRTWLAVGSVGSHF
jgi:hypothetical protein